MGTTLHTLRPNKGATKPEKRLGRGHGSGLHKTSGKGTKGQKARTGHHGIPKPGFEGGQTAMSRRLPKRGFTNHRFRKEIFAVNLGDIAERFDAGAQVDMTALKDKGLVPRRYELVKILGEGDLGKKLTVAAHFFSESAKNKLAQAGGAAQVLAHVANQPTVARPKGEKRKPKQEQAAAKPKATE